MSTSVSDIIKRFPLPVYNYRVSIQTGIDERDKQAADLNSVSFSEVSGLSIDYDKVEYRDGMSFVEGATILSGVMQTLQVTLSKGIVKSGDFLYNWISHSSEKGVLLPVKRNIIIDLCDENGIAVVRWKVYNALPSKLSAPKFEADTNEIAIESLELTANRMVVEFEP